MALAGCSLAGTQANHFHGDFVAGFSPLAWPFWWPAGFLGASVCWTCKRERSRRGSFGRCLCPPGTTSCAICRLRSMRWRNSWRAGNRRCTKPKGFVCSTRSAAAWPTSCVTESPAPGPPPELSAKLFEEFVTCGGRRGAGLAVARQVIVAHGGRIDWLRENGCTCFRIWLPLLESGQGDKS